MEQIIKPLLLIQSFGLDTLVEDYRIFFIDLLPMFFILAVIVEYFDRLEPFSLMKRVFVSILILTTVTSFYASSIHYSFSIADSKLSEQQAKNVFLMDMFSSKNNSISNHIKELESKNSFYKDKNVISGTLAFLKYHLFTSFVNDGFTVSTYFIANLCFAILKAVYSLVYYLGLGLIGIPCLLYLFPTMGNVLRGGIISYIWCLVVPHVLVFIITMIGAEINRGYSSGTIIGGSMMGTTFLFLLTLLIAFVPLIAIFILAGSGVAQAGGVIATVGANWVMNLPRNGLNTSTGMIVGSSLGPKATLAKSAIKGGVGAAKKFRQTMSGFKNRTGGSAHFYSGHTKGRGRVQQKSLPSASNISGYLTAHAKGEQFVTIPNRDKHSGVDFISSPTRNSPSYNSEQKRQIYSSPVIYNPRSSIDGTLSKHQQINRGDKTSRIHDGGRRYRHTSAHSSFRNISTYSKWRSKV